MESQSLIRKKSLKSENLFVIFCLSILLLVPMSSFAKNKTTRLEEIVVTASRFKETRKEVTANISIIDEEEIRLSTAKDLGELLEEENIGYTGQYPGVLTPVGIRGFRTGTHGGDLNGKVLILLNGRRSATGNAAKIMTENIERVEIIRGPASVQYGSSAIGGLINVITKQGKGTPSASVQGALGSFGYDETTGSFSGAIGDFDFSGSIKRSTMDDYDTGSDKEYHNTGYDEEISGSFNLGYEFLPQNRIGIIGNFFDADEAGMPYYISKNDKNDYIDKSNESLDIIYNGATRNNLFHWKARYFFGDDEADWYTVNSTGSTTRHSKRDVDQKGAQAQFTWNPENYEFTGGMDWVNYEIDHTTKPKSMEYDNPAFFLLGKAKFLNKHLILKGGARYDDYEVDLKKWGDTEDDDNISPKLGLAYLVRKNIKLRLNYSQGFKMPTARQLAADFKTGWGKYKTHYVGNPDLDPETSDTYECGIDMYYGAFDSSLTFFYTDFEDKIQQRPGKKKMEKTWKNLGEAELSGFEGETSYDIATFWDLNWKIRPYFDFTYLTNYEDEETGKDLLYTSDLNLSYGLTLSNLDGLSSRINFSYVGEQDIQDWEDYDWKTMAEPERIEKDDFIVADFSIEKRILNFNSYGDLTLRGEVNNLFDKDYSYVKGYPMPGRSFYLGLRYDL